MHVMLLGTAAGGGVPQWNCRCRNCRMARAGLGQVRPRSQSSVAISADRRRWFLLNASPDLARQIEAFPPLHPTGRHPRQTPLQAVLLTNADLDHTLGLLSLRENPELLIYASEETQLALTQGLALLPTLSKFCKTKLLKASETRQRLRHLDGSACSLSFQAFRVPGKRPRFAVGRKAAAAHGASAIGYKIVDEKTGGCLVYLPEILALTSQVISLIDDCDLLLFDGSFWSENELAENGITGRLASQMGHIPIAGEDGSLRGLAGMTAPQKVFVHINNTNPILRENSRERRLALAAGWEIGHDGMEFKL